MQLGVCALTRGKIAGKTNCCNAQRGLTNLYGESSIHLKATKLCWASTMSHLNLYRVDVLNRKLQPLEVAVENEGNPLHIPPPLILLLRLIVSRLNVNWTKSQTLFVLMAAHFLSRHCNRYTYCRVFGEMDREWFCKHSLAFSWKTHCPRSSMNHNGLSYQYMHH